MSELEWWQRRKVLKLEQIPHSQIRAMPVGGEVRVTKSIKVAPSVWKDFKKLCIDRNTTVSEEIERLIQEMLDSIFIGPAIPIDEL